MDAIENALSERPPFTLVSAPAATVGTRAKRKRISWNDHGWRWRQHRDGLLERIRKIREEHREIVLAVHENGVKRDLGAGGSVVVDAPCIRRSVASLRTFPFPHKVHSHDLDEEKSGSLQ